MWIAFNDAFVSVTRDDFNANRFMVRARNADHLKTLFGEGVKIKVTPENDYRFRTFIDRKAFTELVSKRLMDIDYGNFKGSVKDDRLHDMYIEFWQSHWDYQCDVEAKNINANARQLNKEEIAKENSAARVKPTMPSTDAKAAMDKITAMNDKETE